MIDIGFAFLPEFEGKGYGYEAASHLMAEVNKHFGLKRVCAITTQDNIVSQKLLDKLGLQFIKLIQMEIDKDELRYYEKEL
jgi:RimJ/RimL family protein N-acetyltransferase